jgi:phage protein D
VASSYEILLDGAPADALLYNVLLSVEVEESVELPGAIRLELPVTRTTSGDLLHVSDARFGPHANLAVVVTAGDRPPECIFDGYVLSHKVHLDTGTTEGALSIWGQDASWLMNLEEKVREWSDVTDASVANTIFGEYGFDAAAENTEDDSPSHTEAGHTLMQRASDIQFLRQLARRNGKLCRVACGQEAGRRTGFFAKPSLDGEPAVTLTLNPGKPGEETVRALDFEWDVTRPTEVAARQAMFDSDDEDGASGDASDSELSLLDARGLADFSGKPMKVLLTAPVDDAGELQMRARSLLREAAFFARCTGEADGARLKAVLRAGTVVRVEGAGSLYSGKYLVWSVRHRLASHEHTMSFTLVRNAVGPAPSGG